MGFYLWLKAVRPSQVLAWLVSGILVFSALIFSFALLSPIDVLKDWKLTVEPGTHQVGESLAVRNQYDKTRPVSGAAFRYLECKNNPTTPSAWNRYLLSQATANRTQGVSDVLIYVQLPQISNLPSTCRIAVTVDYPVYQFRHHIENATSNEFTLNGPSSPATATPTSVAPGGPTSPDPKVATQVGPILSPTVYQPQSTSQPGPTLSNSSDSTPVITPMVEQPQPSLPATLVNTVEGVSCGISGLLCR